MAHGIGLVQMYKGSLYLTYTSHCLKPVPAIISFDWTPDSEVSLFPEQKGTRSLIWSNKISGIINQKGYFLNKTS